MTRKFVDEYLSEKLSQWAFALAEQKIIRSHIAAIKRADGDFSYDEHYLDPMDLRQLLDDCFEEAATAVYEKMIK